MKLTDENPTASQGILLTHSLRVHRYLVFDVRYFIRVQKYAERTFLGN